MQTIKRTLCLLLTCVLLVGLLPMSALAVEAHVSLAALDYVKNNDGTVIIKDCAEGARGVLEIPATIDGGKVVSIANSAFRGCDQITQVTIPSTVYNIGEYAFSSCTSLTGVVIPDSVTQMGMCAFSECTSLESAVVGNGLKSLPFMCFRGCTSLSQVTLKSGLEELKLKAFYSCSSLRSISLPNTLTTIGDYVFGGTSLTSVVLPSSMRVLDSGFFNCETLKSVTLNYGLQKIGTYAFAGTALESVVIPDTVTEIGSLAFADIPTLRSAVIGGGVKDLEKSCFRNSTHLETLVIREGIKTIGVNGRAYLYCTPFPNSPSLKTIYLPASLAEIGAESFYNSNSIQDIYYAGTAYGWGGVAIGKNNGNILGDNVTMHYVPFRDTNAGDYYYDPMVWAVDGSITNGTSATTFSPNATCTQCQILTFLYRAAGSPSVSGGSAYTNSAVTPDQYYYKAMVWAYQQGVVTNAGLNPNAPCTRADVVTYLWRLNSKPAGGTASFTDVPSSASYAQAVSWAVKSGITNGTSATTFSPSATCTRGQIVTFLYRNFVK